MNKYFVYFDQGEVLFTNDWEFACPEKDQQFYDFYKLTSKEFQSARRMYIDELFRGKITEAEYWHNVLAQAKAVSTDGEVAITLARKYQKWKPGMNNLVTKIRKSEISIGIITTTHKEIWEYKCKLFNIKDWFDPIITSYETGLRKPEPEIFQLALSRANLSPNQVIFIDDTEENVTAANKLGMNGILLINAEDLKHKLTQLGIGL